MAFNKGKYDQQYNHDHIRRKFIPFNNNVPEDVELLAWLSEQGNVTQYVKGLIREDMERNQWVFPEESLSKWLSELKEEPQND